MAHLLSIPTDHMLTELEVARILGLKARSVRTARANGLPFHRICGRILIHPNDVQNLVAQTRSGLPGGSQAPFGQAESNSAGEGISTTRLRARAHDLRRSRNNRNLRDNALHNNSRQQGSKDDIVRADTRGNERAGSEVQSAKGQRFTNRNLRRNSPVSRA
jgi:hypothetical protein